MRRTIVVVATLFAVAAKSVCATTIMGGNLGNQTWLPANSPYVVQGDATVQSGATLIIQAGTVVEFATTDGQASGLDTSRVELTINGSLSINGTAANPVTLMAQSGSAAGLWYGVVVNPSATGAVITNASISNALIAVSSSASTGVLQLSSSTIQSSTIGVKLLSAAQSLSQLTLTACGTGVSLLGSGELVDRLTISGGGTGIALSSGGAGTISNVVISGNTGDGLIYGSAGGTALLLTQATVHSNNRGVVVGTSAAGAVADLTIENSIITSNTLDGVFHDTSGSGSSSVTTNYSDVFGNGTNYSNAVAGPGSISADPMYVLPPGDLHLKIGSAAIDVGSATHASDHDRDGRMRPLDSYGAGAFYDMGAYEALDIIFAYGFE